jgi:hypothetical protein
MLTGEKFKKYRYFQDLSAIGNLTIGSQFSCSRKSLKLLSKNGGKHLKNLIPTPNKGHRTTEEEGGAQDDGHG